MSDQQEWSMHLRPAELHFGFPCQLEENEALSCQISTFLKLPSLLDVAWKRWSSHSSTDFPAVIQAKTNRHLGLLLGPQEIWERVVRGIARGIRCNAARSPVYSPASKTLFRTCFQGGRVTLASGLTLAGGQKIARVYKQNFTGRVTLQPGTT